MSIHWFDVAYESSQNFEKRQAFNKCFKSLRKKQEIFFIKTFIYKEHVIQKDQKIKMKIYMKIDVEMNMINQCLIIKQSMLLLNINLSRFIWMNDQSIYCYDVYEMHYQFINSWNIEKKDISIFYVINKKESFLILSIIINSYILVTSIRSTHEKLYATCIEWTKLSEIENRSQSIRLLHAVETVSFKTMYQICSHWSHVREWVF